MLSLLLKAKKKYGKVGFGEADKKGVTGKDVDQKELKMGIAHELEHTKDKEKAKEIALDHLAEPGNEKYYSDLKNKMKE